MQKSSPSSPSDPNRRNVLVVDTHAVTRELLMRIIEGLGYHVTPSSGGHDAQTLLEAHKTDPFDLIVIEINMLNVDGVEVAEYLRHLSMETPVIFMTDGAPRYSRTILESLSPYPQLRKPLTDIRGITDMVQDVMSMKAGA